MDFGFQISKIVNTVSNFNNTERPNQSGLINITSSNKKEFHAEKIVLNYTCKTLRGHLWGVNSLTLLKDGKIISPSTDNTIKLWDLKTNLCVLTLKSHEKSVMSLIQLKDMRIASCSHDKTIKI